LGEHPRDNLEANVQVLGRYDREAAAERCTETTSISVPHYQAYHF
jgi:hypothetical protein